VSRVVARQPRQSRQPRRPRREGPCGDFSRADNICSADGDCCTGICNTSLGRNNKDGLGRCRCRNRGDACTADRNCCRRRNQQMVCVEGVCGDPAPDCVALAAVCEPQTDTCCQGACSVYRQPICMVRAAEFRCCLAILAPGCVVDADCCDTGAVCAQGACAYP
jgi:hypothetical protein